MDAIVEEELDEALSRRLRPASARRVWGDPLGTRADVDDELRTDDLRGATPE
jgi:hypothetical protein